MRPETLLRLLQISDTAFPTGSFAHSLGLEAFADAGELRNAEELKATVKLYLKAAVTSDCVALQASYDADLAELFRVDGLLSATKMAREVREASASTGRRFLASVSALGVEGSTLQPFTAAARSGETLGNLAVGYGVAAPVLGVGVDEALHAYLYTTAASLVAAGQKLIPLGGSAAQRVLYELGGEIMRVAKTCSHTEVEDMYAFSPTIDVRSMQHERQRTRLYIS